MSNNLNNPIDTDGNAITDATELGDIDMSSANMGDMRSYFVEYIESPETTRTTAYTGVSKDTALRDGKLILYRNQTQASGNWTLNLTLRDGTTTGAKPVYSSGTTNVGTMYKANSVIPMVYRTAANAWYASAGLTLADLSGKVDKANPAVAGNLASLVSGGGIQDSGKKPSDFQTALTAQQLANIAAVSDALAFDATRSYAAGDPVVYNGTLYTFTAAHTGAWTGSDVSAVDIIARLAGKANKSDVDPLLFAQYYPDGSVASAAEFTSGIKYEAPDTTNRTITVKPFCNTGNSADDNSGLAGRVVIPPFVDAQGNGYISDDGTRFKVVGVSSGAPESGNQNLTAIVAPNTVTSIDDYAFSGCTALTTVSFPAVMIIDDGVFSGCTALAFIALPAATSIDVAAFDSCTSLVSVSLPAVTSINEGAFASCASLTSVDFGDTPRSTVPTLGLYAFFSVPTNCKIIVPYKQYDAWKAASGWSSLPQEFVRHSEKADKPATFTTGNFAKFDSNGNPTDAGYHFEVRNGIPCIVQYT